jgi:anti-sigma regulatory factor (Ser/Thr protein kinase)
VSTVVQPTGAWSGVGFAHEAFVFGSDEEAIARCLPFVEEGLERDEQVIVLAGEAVRQALVDQLGGDVARLACLSPAESWWQGGYASLHAFDRDLQGLLATGRPWRLIDEPTWMATPDGEIWSRFESVTNRCYAELPCYCLCLHDTRRFRPRLIDAALRTHPLTWGGSEPVPSAAYVETGSYLRSVEPDWTPRPRRAHTRTVTSPAEARRVIRDLAGGAADGTLEENVVVAVNELVTNALAAAGSAEVSSWTSDGSMVWEVADQGPGMHDVTAGYVPPSDDLDSGRGLWLARNMADDASVRPEGPGTAIRLYFHR